MPVEARLVAFRTSASYALGRMAPSPDSRTGVGAILAGVLIFAGQAGELAFGNALGPVWVAGVVLLGL